MTQDRLFDVVIVGAGLAGAATAAVLGRQGLCVALVDPRPISSPAFRPKRSSLIRRICFAGWA